MPIEADELEIILKGFEAELEKKFEKKLREILREFFPQGTGSTATVPPAQPLPRPSVPSSDAKDQKEKEWDNFFSSKKIPESAKQMWKDSKLTPSEALTACENGWTDLTINSPNDGTGKIIWNANTKTFTYTSYGETTRDVNPLISKKTSLDKKHQTQANISDTEAKWNEFFKKNSINDPKEKEAWKVTSGLTLEEVYQVLDNGWKKLVIDDEIANLGDKKITYTSHGETTDNVELLNHTKTDLDLVHSYIKGIKVNNSLLLLPSNDKIKTTFENIKIPSNRSYREIIEIKESRAKDLFRVNFESGKPNHGLDENKIDLWRTEKTGLSGEGHEERKAFNNGWVDPTKIRNKEVDYEGDKINVLTYNKAKLDKALKILQSINNTNSQHDDGYPLDEWEIAIGQLKDEELPEKYQQETIRKAREDKIATFTYSLTDTRDTNGIDQEEYNKIVEKKAPTNKQTFEGVLTVEILKHFLGKYIEENKKDKYREEDRDLDDFLISNKGYRIEDKPELEIKVEGNWEKWKGIDISKKEKEWIENKEKNKQGKLKLPFFYAINGFDPDELEGNFCAFEIIGGKERLKELEGDKGQRGVLAIGTGVGKTTKTASCLCCGGKRNIILVTPTKGLASSAAKHHSRWLQGDEKWVQGNEKEGIPYKCVYHGKPHGNYPVAVNDLTQWCDGKGKISGSPGVSVLYYGYFLGYMAREMLDVKKILTDVGTDIVRVNKGCIDAKSKMIPEDAIIVFDEADVSKPGYKQTFKGTIKWKKPKKNEKGEQVGEIVKNVLLMSATLEDNPFSITSSFPITSRRMTKFDVSLNNLLVKHKTLLFLPNTNLTDADKKVIEKIPYAILNDATLEVAEEVVGGLPPGSLIFANSDYRRGYTFQGCRYVIDTGREEIESIVVGGMIKTEKKRYSLPGIVQGRGRAGRVEEGYYYTISTKTEKDEEISNASSALVKAIFGDPASLKKDFFKHSDSDQLVECVRAAFAFNDQWGKEPEVILAGLLAIIRENNNFPAWRKDKGSTMDEIIWKKLQGVYEPPTMGAEQAKQALCLMIQTHLNNEKNIASEIKYGLVSPLIRQAGLKKEGEKGYQNSINEIRKVLNGVINDKLEALGGVKTSYKGSEREVFNKVSSLLWVIKDVEITIVEKKEKDSEKNKKSNEKEKKDEKPYILKIVYPKGTDKQKVAFKTSVAEQPEEDTSWKCGKCKEMNWEGEFCRICKLWKETDYYEEDYKKHEEGDWIKQMLVETTKDIPW